MSKVRGYRVMLGLTQKGLGQILGCSVQSVSSKENGKTPFNDKEKIIILEMVKKVNPEASIDDLFFSHLL